MSPMLLKEHHEECAILEDGMQQSFYCCKGMHAGRAVHLMGYVQARICMYVKCTYNIYIIYNVSKYVKVVYHTYTCMYTP